MGPIGAVVAPLAGVALQAASKLTESSFEKASESQIKSTLDGEGAVHRAILCENNPLIYHFYPVYGNP